MITRRSDDDVTLEIEDALDQRRLRPREHFLLERVEPVRPACRPRAGSCRPWRRRCDRGAPPGLRRGRARCGCRYLADVADRARGAVVKRHEVLRAEKEIDFLRPELVLLGLEVDAVQDQVEVVAVGFDFRMVYLGDGVFDRELVEVKDVGEQPRFVRCGRAQSRPTPRRRCPVAARPGPPGRRSSVDPSSCL